jgi:hypothetical protein
MGSVWKKWSGEIARADKDDFERKIIPLLRLWWPQMQQSPRLRIWDQRGIDLFEWADEEPFSCCVQCKGFQAHTIGPEQLNQALESIEKFSQSRVRCHTYLLVHNRDGRNRAFHKSVNEALALLVSRNLVTHAKVWDRETLLAEAQRRMEQFISEDLTLRSKELLARQREQLGLLQHYVSPVPIIEQKIFLSLNEPGKIAETRKLVENPARLLVKDQRSRWTLLTGIFGIGKTTAALMAAASGISTVILAQCSKLPEKSDRLNSTNQLCEQVLFSSGIFAGYEAADRDMLSELGGDTLAQMLKRPNSRFIFILDGLDENRTFNHVRGLQRLNNQVADFNCRIVFTTRVEHFHALFGNFNMAFSELGTKRNTSKHVRVYQLSLWEEKQSIELVRTAARSATGRARHNLETLATYLKNGKYQAIYGDLPRQPLFLQFIIEDVAESGIHLRNRTDLLRRWFERKIRRDRRVESREGLGEELDFDDVVERTHRMMEDVAYHMILEHAQIELTETIDASRVEEIGRLQFGDAGIVPILLNSVLVAFQPRSGSRLKISFALRIFQEYFLAVHVKRHALDSNLFPQSVQTLVADLRSREHKQSRS